MTVTIGSLCSGYGGLDMGLALGLSVPTRTAWHVEYDKDPSKILAHRFPGVPNHGDVKTTDWAAVEPVDWLTAGYPCQPFSHAGLRKGADDPRHLWPGVARAISVLRPRNVLLENVRGHVSLGLDAVLADLAGLGYDAGWGLVRAADAGAPHGRARIFIVATDTEGKSGSVGHGDDVRAGSGTNRRGQAAGRSAAADARGERHGRGQDARRLGRLDRADEELARERQPARTKPEHRSGEAAADADSLGHERFRRARYGWAGPADSGDAAPDATGDGRGEGWTEPARLVGRPDAAERGLSVAPDADSDGLSGQQKQHAPEAIGLDGEHRGHADGRGDGPDWGPYASAVRRWERVTGRAAPRPTEPGRNGERLSPRFVEWMMGLPAGWVTDVPDLSRNAQLKALGNGVVPQQAALAVRLLTAQAVAA